MALLTTRKKMVEMNTLLQEQGMKIASLQRELKGYYSLNDENDYFKRLFSYTNFQTTEFKSFERSMLYDTYRTNSCVFGIIDRISKAVGEIGKYIELQTTDGEMVEKHWIIDLLRSPNDRFSLYNFLYAWATNYEVFGDAFVFAKKEIGKSRQIKEMYIIPSQIVTIAAGGWQQPFRGINLATSTETEPISSDDFFMSFIYNMQRDSFFGFSPLQAAAYDVQLLKRGKERMNTTMDNGGVNTIITPARDKEGYILPQAADLVEEEMNALSSANKTKFLRQAIEAHSIGSTPVELGIIDGSKEAVTALCFVYNMPVDLYYGQSKYENAKEAKKALYEGIAIPLISLFCQDFMSFVNRGRRKDTEGLVLVLNTDKIEALKDSETDVLNNLTLMNASLNEKRKAMGYAPIIKSYADEPMLSLGVQFGPMAYDINEND
jgi:HK97 family phage portal protein